MPADFGWSDLGTWGSLLSQSHTDLNRQCLDRKQHRDDRIQEQHYPYDEREEGSHPGT